MSTETRYVIEGNLLDGHWVNYGDFGPVTEDEARGILKDWQDSRDRNRFEIRYRLVRRTVTDEILTEEGAAP